MEQREFYQESVEDLPVNRLGVDGWIGLIATAALVAALIVGVVGFDAHTLLTDPNLAP